MGRSIAFDRHTVLENALALFWLRGFSAASLRQLEDVTELNPGSLYYHFSSKEKLFLAALQHYIDCHLQARINKNLSSGNPLEGLRRFLTSGYRHSQETQYRNCCFLACTCSELNLLPPVASELINTGLDSIRSGFQTQLERAFSKGMVNTEHPITELSQELLNLYLGLQLLAQVRPNQHLLDSMVRQSLENLLQPKVR